MSTNKDITRTNRLQRLRPWTTNNSNTDSGFGSALNNHDRLVARDGSFNIERVGMEWTPLSFYQSLVTISWTKFNLLILAFYVLFNMLFGFLFMVIGIEHLNGIEPSGTWLGDFEQCFFFSVQTFATIGYGAISPKGFLPNILVTIEALVGIMTAALATGLLYGRFSRPSVKLGFSQNALIAPYQDGTNGFMCRLCNLRTNKLIECEAQIMVSILRPVDEAGTLKRIFVGLPLQISKIQYFTLSWTLNHPITPDSPLYALTAADLEAGDAEFLVMMKCFDDTFLQTVYINSSYKWQEVVWGAKFLPMVSYNQQQQVTLDYTLLNAHQPAELFAERVGEEELSNEQG